VAQVGIKELLEAGVHFGHQTRRWNPKMRRFIFGERGGIYIIDLLRTEALLDSAQRFADGLARRGGTVLFVGTKKQARDGIKEFAEAAGQPYVNHRWLGGLLTNFQTISARIKRLHDLERYESEGQLALLPTRERLAAQADLEKLRANLGGVKNMQRVPDALFVIDLKTEAIAVREAQRLRIPIIGLVDTNCDPDGIDYVIPGNDDAIRACNVITRAIGDVIAQGRRTFREEEERARREAEEQSRREAEERARREAEEQARQQAEAEAELTRGGEGLPRDEAEQVVADAVQDLGRPAAEGRRSAEAGAAAQAADEPAVAATGNVGPGSREARSNPNVGDRVPQEAGAAQGAGSPASETAGEPAAEPPARRARSRARQARQAPPAPAPEPGPSAAAQAAEAEAPPQEGEARAEQAAAETPEAAAAPAAETPEAAAPAAAETPEAPAPASAETPDASSPAALPDAAYEEAREGAEDTGLADRAQGAAGAAAGTAQDVAAGVAGAAEAAAGAVAERAPGPLGAVAGAAAGAAGAVRDAVSGDDDQQTENKTQEKDEK
jgi:small subunit ribosomal protein S2